MDVVVVIVCRDRGAGLFCCRLLLQQRRIEWPAHCVSRVCHHVLILLQLRWGLRRVSAVRAGVLLLLFSVEGLLSVSVGLFHAARRLRRRAALCWFLRIPSHICWNCDASRRHARWWCLQWNVGLGHSVVGARLLHQLSRWVSDQSATMLAGTG